MNPASAGPSNQKWTRTRWLAAIAIVFALHVALIFVFGARKPVTPTPVKNVPSLALAGESSTAWLALNNATLFALPDRGGFAGLMWLDLPPATFISPQDWTQKPRWLAVTDSVPIAALGTAFNQFVQTNPFATVHLEFNQLPQIAAPETAQQPPFAQNSTLEIRGEIAKRRLLNVLNLPSLPRMDVIPPSVVQVLVDAAGNVLSAAIMPPENFSEALEIAPVRDNDANERAVELARTARFAPLESNNWKIRPDALSSLTLGQLVFNWRTVPVTTTNAFH